MQSKQTIGTNTEPPRSPLRITAGAHFLPLDGIRGVAILSVVFFHCSRILPPQGSTVARGFEHILSAGWAGVDLFFVLSGFLITGILLDARGEGSQVPENFYRSFWTRRALRIFPLYLAFLVLVLIISPGKPSAPSSPLWHWFYGSNILFSFSPKTAVGGHTAHLWSLSVEEQFYLIWPFVIALLPRRRIVMVCLLLIVAAPMARLFFIFIGTHTAAYEMTPARADTLAMGSLIAALVRMPGGRERLRPILPAMTLLSLVVLGALLIRSQGLPATISEVQLVGYTALVTLSGGMLWLALDGGLKGYFPRFFSLRPLRVAGKYSYSMYLFNSVLIRPIATWLFPGQKSLSLLPFFGYTAAVLAGTFGAAWLTWHLYEVHWLKLKRFAPMPRPQQSSEVRPPASDDTKRVPTEPFAPASTPS